MKRLIVHLSDIHFVTDFHESIGVVMRAFKEDVKEQVKSGEYEKYLVISGDLVKSGADNASYKAFISYISSCMEDVGIGKDRIFCVPGNHDINSAEIKKSLIGNKAVFGHVFGETEFNDWLREQEEDVYRRFNNYNASMTDLSSYWMTKASVGGFGEGISDDVGIYLLNSAVFSVGGVRECGNDFGRLCVDTRSINKWVAESNYKHKILVMHHPVEWLASEFRFEIERLIERDFSLVLHGHVHEKKNHIAVGGNNSAVVCSSPALFTSKYDDIGYSIIRLSDEAGIEDAVYRQWSKRGAFVPGVGLVGNESGIVSFKGASGEKSEIKKAVDGGDLIARMFEGELDRALSLFSSQPRIWINRKLSARSEDGGVSREEGEYISQDDLLSSTKSYIIRAPAQFGLTCLARYLVKAAWEQRQLWLYLDAKEIKPYRQEIEAHVKEKLSLLGVRGEDISCVVIDSWHCDLKKADEIIKHVASQFDGVRVIVMQTMVAALFNSVDIPAVRDFEVLYLCSLPREDIRSVVSIYNGEKRFGEDNAVLAKVVSDLDVLNIPRTPLNCLTLLKVLETSYDESPVNRCEMINRVLNLLFNFDIVPTYRTKPDLKDCEYVLGYFCEGLIRRSEYVFGFDDFNRSIRAFCRERLIDVESSDIFDVLYRNNVIVRTVGGFCFKFTYWIYYFAAQRMHQDPGFAKFIFEEKRYASYPEMIEFYTGIDRRRNDALEVLIADIKRSCALVDKMSGLPEDFLPYSKAQWKPSDNLIGKIKEDLEESVLNSNLPDFIKDRYADRSYDRSRPYRQQVIDVLEEYTMIFLMKAVSAGARALRNSDFASPELKKELLSAICESLEQVNKILVVIAPALAQAGHATYKGAGFILDGDFGSTPEERFNNLLSCIPENVVRWYQGDIYSPKIGPLIYSEIGSGSRDVSKHYMMLLLVSERPKGWEKHIDSYIASLHKNSFYLLDIFKALRAEFQYAFADRSVLEEIGKLAKKCLAKHELGVKNPGEKLIGKIDDEALS